jgi:hypothetical protein
MENTGRIHISKNRKDIIYRITENNCHEVISHCERGETGYYCIKIEGKVVDIHRWLYENYTGLNLQGLDVRHKCDNRSCINIEHLEHGTRRENVNDMLKRKRQRSILTEEDVISIVDMYFTQKMARRAIAELTNMHMSSISDIVYGKTWTHITGIKHKSKKK